MTAPDPLVIVTTELPAGRAGQDYLAYAAATGGIDPYSWTFAGLPGGLTGFSDGHIGGVPASNGSFTISATVTDSDVAPQTATSTLALVVGLPLPLQIGELPASASAGTAFRLVLPVTGGLPPYSWQVSGLPPGWSFDGTAVSGRADTPGPYAVSLQVTDAGGSTASATWKLSVLAGPVAVWWDDLNCSPGWLDGEFTAVVTDVAGWFDTPPNQGHDASLVLADGGVYGPKTLDPRVITVQGAAAGPRSRLIGFRDQLAARTVRRDPGTLTIDDWTWGPRTATVRASTDQLTFAWLGGSQGFTWQAVLTANDPRLYGGDLMTAQLTTGEEGYTGRAYPREYRWNYGGTTGMPNFAVLLNEGDTWAPVTATYTGPLGQTRLAATGSPTGIIVGALAAGQTLTVNCETLVARTDGAIRQSMIGAGSVPMPLAPGTTTWWLWGSGEGTVTLTWRSVWL